MMVPLLACISLGEWVEPSRALEQLRHLLPQIDYGAVAVFDDLHSAHENTTTQDAQDIVLDLLAWIEDIREATWSHVGADSF